MTSPPPDQPSRLVLDFDTPMRPKARARVKIIPGPETPPRGGSFAFARRGKLYEVLAGREDDA